MRENKNKAIKGVKVPLGKSGKCPFIKNSFPECYCNDMSSLKADEAIYYCGRHFEECPIYREKTAALVENEKKLKQGVAR